MIKINLNQSTRINLIKYDIKVGAQIKRGQIQSKISKTD